MMENKEKLNLEELAAEARREYHRKWRAENKDKVKKNATNFWLRKAERLLKESK